VTPLTQQQFISSINAIREKLNEIQKEILEDRGSEVDRLKIQIFNLTSEQSPWVWQNNAIRSILEHVGNAERAVAEIREILGMNNEPVS
jgi:Mg2+ and Co2+ transporter CorA